MPDLRFSVEKAEAVRHAASPMLNFALNICDDSGETIQAIVLRCQIRIEPARRDYRPQEQERLGDLFGEPSRWGQTLRPMLWTHASVVTPPFEGSVTVDLPVPCTYDFNVAAAKYFHALENGEVPLRLLFSGTVFQHGPDGNLQICQIPWEKETTFRLPVEVWKRMMEIYYPNCQWLSLRRDIFDQLQGFKSRNGLPTLEAAIEKLVAEAGEEAPR
ncbi:MAG TPA: DUF6084 family protein [Tepidisphaeraceae bacterium]|nr:DUF6084 family protein [Tepidisphaeraceae bacterium]